MPEVNLGPQEKNPFRAFLHRFTSLDSFTKSFVVIVAIFLVITPLTIGTILIFRPNASEPSQVTVPIYQAGLAPGWQDWSWDAINNFTASDSARQNTVISFSITSRYAGLYLHTDQAVSIPTTAVVQFDIEGTTPNQSYGVRLQTASDRQIGREVFLANAGGDPVPNSWKSYAIPYSLFSSRKATVGGFIIQDESGVAPQLIYVDNIRITYQSSVSPSPSPLPTPIPSVTPLPSISQTITPTGSPSATSGYPWHTNIVSTTFWIGEIFNTNLSDGSQVCSTYDKLWAFHFSGINAGTVPSSTPGCPGSILGGCDGVGGYQNCQTEKRTAANNYFPTKMTPKENPFYLDLPFDDLNDPIAFSQRCQVVPWANQPGFAGHCSDTNFSYMKNRWVKIVGPNGNTCYGQNEDAGPSHGSLYHDANYVFSATNAQPVQGQFNNAGMDVSPALNGCLGFADLNGDSDHVNWQFVDDANVAPGPWKILTTSSGVTQ